MHPNPTDKSRQRVLLFGVGVPLVLLILLIWSLLLNFSITSQNTARLMVESTLKAQVEEFSNHLEEELAIMTQSGTVIRDVMESRLPKKRADALPMIGALCANSNAYMVVYCDTAGVGITNTGIHVNVTRDGILRLQAHGITSQYYTYVEKERIMQAEALVSVIPVRRDGAACGYLLMYYSVDRMRQIFSQYIAYRDSSLIFSVDSGLVISTEGLQQGAAGDGLSSAVHKTTLPDLLHSLDPTAGTRRLLEDMEDSQTGSIELHTGGGIQHVFYHPVGINDWYLAVGVAPDVYNGLLLRNWADMHRLITYLLVLLGVFIGVVCSLTFALRTVYRRRSRHLEKQADTDQQTGLYNKTAANREVSAYMEQNPGALCLLFILDVDNFKQINDSYGHATGDQVISAIGSCMRGNFRSDDIVGRIGGDEFLIFLKDLPSEDVIRQQMKRVCSVFRALRRENETHLEISISIGAAVFPRDADSFIELYKAADRALYEAKKSGGGCLCCTKGGFQE